MNGALPSLSDEAIVRDRIAMLETSTTFIAALARIPQSRLSLAFSGNRALSREDGELLKDLTARLLQLKAACGIIPLSLNNAERVRHLLNRMEERNITAAQVKTVIDGLLGGDQ
jgi:hypothetical protein